MLRIGGMPGSMPTFGRHGNTAPLSRLVADPAELIGQTVFVYRNLNRDTWSLRAADGPDAGYVVGHADKLLVENARFKVSEAGRQRVIREKKKDVHAGVEGTLVAVGPESDRRFRRRGAVAVTYNPFKTRYFIQADTRAPLARAHQVLLDMNPPDGPPVLAQGVTYQTGELSVSA